MQWHLYACYCTVDTVWENISIDVSFVLILDLFDGLFPVYTICLLQMYVCQGRPFTTPCTLWETSSFWYKEIIRATSWENLFLLYANNKGADHPAHQRSLISAFVVRCLDSIIPLASISEMPSLLLPSVDAQSGLSLTWSKISVDRFSRNEAQLLPWPSW